MADAKDIVFRPYLGVASSPLEENALSIAIDNDTVEGVARINYATVLVDRKGGESEALTDAVRFRENQLLDSDGGYWKYVTSFGGGWENVAVGTGDGNDFIIWQDYSFIFRNNQIDVIKISDGSLTAAWQSDEGTVAVLGQDDVIYVGDNNIVRTIARGTGGFDSASGDTYL